MHKALGRGLESLLSVSAPPAPAVNVAAIGESVVSIPIEKIKPNRYQPRTNFDEPRLRELADSIRQHGLAQPLLVTPSMVPGEYELIAGERRWRASRMAGLREITAVVRQADDKKRFELALIENLQRENLNPIEEGKAYQRLTHEFSLTQEQLAQAMGKDRSVVANSMRLLNLPEDIQGTISMGAMSPGHGRILAGIDDHARQQDLAARIMREKLTVREVEKIVADWKSVLKGKEKKFRKQDAEMMRLSEELQRRFGTKISLVGTPKKGKIEINYFSLAELERISALLLGIKTT